MPKLRSALSKEGIPARRTLTSICRDSVEIKRPSSCCDRKEAAIPHQVDAATVHWCIIHGVNPPPPPPFLITIWV